MDFEEYRNFSRYIVSGDRVFDMALRLKYAEINPKEIEVRESLGEAIDTGVKAVKENELLWILATYSAMLDVRKILTGRKIL